jgi:hypothetical protein
MSDETQVPSEGGDYEVGYGKPPVGSRFKKGQSGNPKGRPKGSENFATMMRRILTQQVVINENGRRKVVTKMELATTQLVNKAASGDMVAMRYLMPVMQMLGNPEDNLQTNLSDADERLLKSLFKRLNPNEEGDAQ